MKLEGQHTEATRAKFKLPNDDWELHDPEEWNMQCAWAAPDATKLKTWEKYNHKHAKAINKACCDAMWKARSRRDLGGRGVLVWIETDKVWTPAVWIGAPEGWFAHYGTYQDIKLDHLMLMPMPPKVDEEMPGKRDD